MNLSLVSSQTQQILLFVQDRNKELRCWLYSDQGSLLSSQVGSGLAIGKVKWRHLLWQPGLVAVPVLLCRRGMEDPAWTGGQA